MCDFCSSANGSTKQTYSPVIFKPPPEHLRSSYCNAFANMSGLEYPSLSEATPPDLGVFSIGQPFSASVELKAAMANRPTQTGSGTRYDKPQHKVNMGVWWITECTLRVGAAFKQKIGCVKITAQDATHNLFRTVD